MKACLSMLIIKKCTRKLLEEKSKLLREIPKKNDFVLMKSLVSFYGQVNKALRSISYLLVSLLALFY